MKYKLSVIAGIYFPPEVCFRKFLDSCLNQDMYNIEFIFLLDHPEDKNSRKVLDEYKIQLDNNKNTFVVIENEKNLGVIDTYLKGCDLANSDTLMIVDSDDFFDLDLLSKMYNYFINKNLVFLRPTILAGYLGKLDMLCFSYHPGDTGIMFKKEILNLDEYSDFKNHINDIAIPYMYEDKDVCLPLEFGSFYYYTITDRSATSSFILQNNKDIPKPKDYDLHKQNVINSIKDYFSEVINYEINPEDYSLEELEDLIKQHLDLDNFLPNNLSYKELTELI
ncbi:MAG: glycosyltransferase [Bacilli bacterium]|nr:glycosyltransferase [Bacilli bacterium]